jgi:hypothetical protein
MRKLGSLIAQVLIAISSFIGFTSAIAQASGSYKGTANDRPSACVAAKDNARSELGVRVSHRCPGGVNGTRFDANVEYSFSNCDCESKDGRTICAVDAEASCKTSGASSSSSSSARSERSFLGGAFSRNSACDEAKNKASTFAKQNNKSVNTGSCECESSNNGVAGIWHTCRVDAAFR